MENEIWKDIKGYENRYQASNLGRIKSLGKGKTHKKERILKQSLRSNYYCVDLCKEGHSKTFSVHRLVWSAFNDIIPEGMQVNHINEVKTDNRLCNLNLMTPKENVNWGESLRNRANTQTNGKCSKKVFQYSLDGVLIKVWPSRMEIQRALNYNNALISQCCIGKTPSAYGYLWKNVI